MKKKWKIEVPNPENKLHLHQREESNTLHLRVTERGWEEVYQACKKEVAVLDLIHRLFTPPWESFSDRFPLT